MNICFITDNPETSRHPVIGRVLEHLAAKHALRILDVDALTGDEAIARADACPLADIYLLKSHSLQALRMAQHLEDRGALVVNSWASSLACQDRVRMAQRMKRARLPWPPTWSFVASEHDGIPSDLRFPLMIKSRHSRRGDLVEKVLGLEQLQLLTRQRKEEPFILQEFVPGDGWDVKLWVIGREVFAARRPTPLEAHGCEDDIPLSAEAIPTWWKSIALRIGRAFGLRLYGADLLINKKGPVVVDVNSFPGFRGVAGADAALVALIERLAHSAPPVRTPVRSPGGLRRVVRHTGGN